MEEQNLKTACTVRYLTLQSTCMHKVRLRLDSAPEKYLRGNQYLSALLDYIIKVKAVNYLHYLQHPIAIKVLEEDSLKGYAISKLN